MQRKDQRVGVFVDVQNMYYSSRALYDQRVDFGEILKEAIGDRQCIRAFAYVIQAEQEDESTFFDALRERGFELRSKPIQNFRGGNQKGDWDIGIAMDIVQMLPKLDVVVLISGDGDFAELLKYIKSRGARAEVMAFGSSASSLLRAEADAVFDLSSNTKRFLIPKKHFRKIPSAKKQAQI
ncbi:MAG: NYN domain-containing protein [Candidatus Kerfeldbacteria bacterium]|nr:NYN domain-containing protein [Candidatus Kerfeldbacteria bacterium]